MQHRLRGIGHQIDGAGGEFDRQPALRPYGLRIEPQRLLELQHLFGTVLPRRRAEPHGPAAQDVIAGIRCLDLPRCFDLDQFEVQRHRYSAGDLILQGEEVAGLAGKTLRPQVRVISASIS